LKTKHGARLLTIITIVAVSGLQAFASPPAPMETWKSMMSQGELSETKHNYAEAIQCFKEASAFAERNNLPGWCWEMSTCREAADEVQVNLITTANANCDRLIASVEKEKAHKALHADLEVWILNLANAYQAHVEPQTREQCLLKLCQINKVLYGENNKEYKNARTLLGKYYENGQAVKAAQIQTSSDEDGIRHAEVNSDPLQRGFNLNQLALHCRMTGELDRAKVADLQLVKMAKTYPQIADGLTTYYSSLGTIEMAHGNISESKGYFAKALKEAAKVRGNKHREQVAIASLSTLVQSVKSDKNQAFPNLAGDELTELLSVQQAISADPRGQYTLQRLLSETLYQEHKFEESEKHMVRAIEIAKLPNSNVEKDISGLYMKLALNRVSRKQMPKANEYFAKALDSEKNKIGFNATQVLVFWGGLAVEQKYDLDLAAEKLNTAIKQALALSPAERGTLLADALWGLRAVNYYKGNHEAERLLGLRVNDEVKLQRQLHTNLGPNFFHFL
jgi:hypothetical protein